ncbi:hypothetical protein G7Y79_00030g064330 [Physcia stellaris]|nr:hypothetical protein G7Y79_00030g064330 [Physcia stellaris]
MLPLLWVALSLTVPESDTWTPGISIHTKSVDMAYTSLKACPWDVFVSQVKCGTLPRAPTLPSMMAMLTTDLDRSQKSMGQETTALSNLSTGFELVQALIYLSTNNSLFGKSLDQFLEWVADSSRRWVLKSIFSYKTPTTEILATNLLLHACTVDDIDLVHFLLTVGADANVRTFSECALRNAIGCGSVRLVRLLIDRGAEINPRLRHIYEITPLELAVSIAKSGEIVQSLLELGADVNACATAFDREWLSLLGLAAKSGCKIVVQMLLKAGASIDQWSPTEGTALQAAAENDNMDIVHMLLANGCHVDAPLGSSIEPNYDTHMFPPNDDTDNAYISPLVHATRNGNVLMVKALLDARANPDPRLSKRRQSFLKDFASLSPDSRTAVCNFTDTALQTAVFMKNYELMEVLMSAGASVDGHECGDSPLQIAAKVDDITLAISLIAYGANIDAPADWPFGKTAVQAASANGNIDLLELLLNGVSNIWRLQTIDAPPSRIGGRTALQAAAEKGQVEALVFLLELGANVNGVPAERFGVTTLQAAAISGSLTIANLVLLAGADTNTPLGTVSALTVAVSQDNLPMFELLLQNGLDVNSAPNKYGRSPLQVAAMQKSTVYLRRLIGAGADVNACWSEGSEATALHTAVRHNRFKATQLLLQAGAFPNLAAWPDLNVCLNREEILPINSELVTLMHRYGFEYMQIDDPEGRVTLEEASDALHIDEDVLRRYLPSLKTEYSGCIDGSSALTIAIYGFNSTKSSTDLIQLLIDYGANVDSRIYSDFSAKSLLGYAAGKRLQDVVGILLTSGANVNWRFSLDDETALASAIYGRNDAIVHMILDAGADTNTFSPGDHCRTPLQLAAMSGNPDHVRLLLARGANVNAPPVQHAHYRTNEIIGVTALQAAIRSGNEEIIHLILEAGADINAPASPFRGMTALQQAAVMGSLRHVRMLLQKGADVNAPPCEKGGVTALQAASIKGHLAVAIYLLDAGADINSPGSDVEGRTALQGAAENGRLDVVALLLENDNEMEGFYDRCEDAAEYAEYEHYPVIARMLREYRKD